MNIEYFNSYNEASKNININIIIIIILIIIYFFIPLKFKPINKFIFQIVIISLLLFTIYKQSICTNKLFDLKNIFSDTIIRNNFIINIIFTLIFIFFSFYIILNIFK